MAQSLKIGFIPTRMYVFSLEDAFAYKNRIKEKVYEFGIDFVDIDDVADQGMLGRPGEVALLLRRCWMKKWTACFSPTAISAVEYLVAQAAKRIGKPVMIWGPRDDAHPEGEHTRDTSAGCLPRPRF